MSIFCYDTKFCSQDGVFYSAILENVKTAVDLWESPRFTCCDGDIEWAVRIFPNGDREESHGFLSVFVEMFRSHIIPLKAQISVSLRNLTPDKRIYTNCFTVHEYPQPEEGGWGWSRYFKRSNLINAAYRIEVLINHSFANSRDISLPQDPTEVNIRQTRCERVQTFAFLRENLTDVTLQCCDGAQLGCHKAVLSSHSDVLRTLFTGNSEFTENKSSIVKVNYPEEIVELLLQYMYSGEFSTSVTNLQQLLVASDYYAIADLKLHCEDSLSAKTTDHDLADMIQLAKRVNALKLKSSCITKLKRLVDSGKWCKLLEGKPWRRMMKHNQELFVEINRELAEKNAKVSVDNGSDSDEDEEGSSRASAPAQKEYLNESGADEDASRDRGIVIVKDEEPVASTSKRVRFNK